MEDCGRTWPSAIESLCSGASSMAWPSAWEMNAAGRSCVVRFMMMSEPTDTLL